MTQSVHFHGRLVGLGLDFSRPSLPEDNEEDEQHDGDYRSWEADARPLRREEVPRAKATTPPISIEATRRAARATQVVVPLLVVSKPVSLIVGPFVLDKHSATPSIIAC